MSSIITGNQPNNFNGDTTVNGDIDANNIPTQGSVSYTHLTLPTTD